MRSNYKKIGDYIREVNMRNTDLSISKLVGVSMEKTFISSVANIVDTDMSVYKVLKKGQLACKLMSVGRDEKLPVDLYQDEEPAIVSSAYYVFEPIDTNILNPEYLFMWLCRPENDRYIGYISGGDVRGGISWETFCDIPIIVPTIEKQREIIKEYNVIKDRIGLNNSIIQKLEETAQAIYKQWFVDFEFPDANGNPYKSSGGEMVWCEELEQDIPKRWKYGVIGDYAKVKSGYAFKSDWWKKSGVPVIKIGSISNNSIDYDSLDFVDSEKLEKASNYKTQEGGIVIAMTGATIGKIGIVPNIKDSVLVNQRVGLFDLGSEPLKRAPFLYLILIDNFTQNQIKNVGGDSAQANISNVQIENIPVVLSEDETIMKLNKTLLPSFRIILNKINENHSLYCLKNLLLSKVATVNN